MEIVIHTTNKTITITGEVNLLELFQQLTEYGIDFSSYKLIPCIEYQMAEPYNPSYFQTLLWVQTGTTVSDSPSCLTQKLD